MGRQSLRHPSQHQNLLSKQSRNSAPITSIRLPKQVTRSPIVSLVWHNPPPSGVGIASNLYSEGLIIRFIKIFMKRFMKRSKVFKLVKLLNVAVLPRNIIIPLILTHLLYLLSTEARIQTSWWKTASQPFTNTYVHYAILQLRNWRQHRHSKLEIC